MVLTLKASAQQVLVSQLQCAFVLPARVRILVNCDGAAWVGSRSVQYRNGQGWRVSHLVRFKDEADYVFPAGTVPNGYRPTACPEEVCNPDDDDDGWNNGGDGNISELDALLNAPMPTMPRISLILVVVQMTMTILAIQLGRIMGIRYIP